MTAAFDPATAPIVTSADREAALEARIAAEKKAGASLAQAMREGLPKSLEEAAASDEAASIEETESERNYRLFIEGMATHAHDQRQDPTHKANGHADSSGFAPVTDANLGMLLFGEIDDIASADRLVKGLIGEESLAVMAGPAGSGKTFLALLLAICLAMAQAFFGRKTLHSGVLYVGAEGQAGLKKRIKAFKIHNSIGDEVVPFALYPAPIDLVTDPKGADAIIERVELLKKLWPDVTTWLVVIDTLARCFGSGDESATRDMNTFVTRCDTIRHKCKAAVLIVHHFGKDESKGMRGSVALKAAADTVIEVTGTSGTRTAKVEKQKDGETGEQFGFSLKPVRVGTDEDGEDITSCVVEPADPETAKKMAAAKLSAPCQIALAALKDAIAAEGKWPPSIDHPGAGIKGVPVETWRRFAYQQQISDGESTDARKKAFKRASQQLQARKVIGCLDEFAWPIA